MHVKTTSTLQNHNTHSSENTHLPVNGPYKANSNINFTLKKITGLTEVSNGNITLDNCQAIHRNSYAQSSEVLVQSNNGKININNGSEIGGSVLGSNGKISITHSAIEGSVENSNGDIILAASRCCAVVTQNGKVELSDATVFSVNNSNGKVVLDRTVVTKDVKISNGTLSVNRSKILGQLELSSNKLTVGEDSVINDLRLIHVKTLSSVSSITVFGGNNIKISIGGSAEKVTQQVTLENGSRLHHLEFTGEKCILTLKGTAEYTGPSQDKLEIIRH